MLCEIQSVSFLLLVLVSAFTAFHNPVSRLIGLMVRVFANGPERLGVASYQIKE